MEAKQGMLLWLMLVCMSSSTAEETAIDELNRLKQELKLLTEQVAALEARVKATKEQSNRKQVKAQKVVQQKSSNMNDRFAFAGDFRYREEYTDQRGLEPRFRHRVRLRLSASAQINERLDLNARLATGVDNPASANQTLDGSFNIKDFGLDRAYFNFKLTEHLLISGGKLANPAYKAGGHQMVWDNDVNPEGLALQLNQNSWKGNLVGYSVEEFINQDDILMFGGQLNKHLTLGSGQLVIGLSYYDYRNIQGAMPLYDGFPRGNSTGADGRLINDYNLLEGSVEYRATWLGQPLSLFGGFVTNTGVDRLADGLALGLNYGQVKQPGSWLFSYHFMDIDADAVVGMFNNSDFGGGSAGTRGHIFRGAYGLLENTSLAMAYFSNELNKDSDTPVDYDRLQLDFILKFK